MKKAKSCDFCSRCGCEIPPDERLELTGSTCALCHNMALEAHEIRQNKRKIAKPTLSIVYAIKSQ